MEASKPSAAPESAVGGAPAAALVGESAYVSVEQREEGEESALASAQAGSSKQPAQKAKARGRAGVGRTGAKAGGASAAVVCSERPVMRSMSRIREAAEAATRMARESSSLTAAAAFAEGAAEGQRDASLAAAQAAGMHGKVERNPEATGGGDFSHLERAARARAGRSRHTRAVGAGTEPGEGQSEAETSGPEWEQEGSCVSLGEDDSGSESEAVRGGARRKRGRGRSRGVHTPVMTQAESGRGQDVNIPQGTVPMQFPWQQSAQAHSQPLSASDMGRIEQLLQESVSQSAGIANVNQLWGEMLKHLSGITTGFANVNQLSEEMLKYLSEVQIEEPSAVPTSVGQAAAPSSGGTTSLQQILQDPVRQGKVSHSGGTLTIQDFFPVSYKKKSRMRRAASARQQESPLTPKSVGLRTLLLGVNNRMTRFASLPRRVSQLGQFQNQAGAPLFSRGTQPSSSQMPQTPLVSVSAAASKLQSPQMTPLYRQVPTEFPALPDAKVDWQDIRAELEKEKGLLQGSGNIVMPVNYDAQGQNPRWERLDRGAIKDLAKAIRDNGLSSPYFKQMLKSIFGMYDLTPYDLKYLATSVLTDTQALIWQKAWRRSLEELRARYQGRPNANLTMVQLAGDPPEDDPTQQAVRLPRHVLSDIKEAARRAILQIAPAGVQDNIYTEIKQGSSEPFSSFVDRLSQAVERQVTEEGAKPHLTKSLAFSNANPECRRIISMMPHQATLADMIKACSKERETSRE
ncbi:uncharacterized protein [Taeniopygia guttata]|uniref:uncharacterized protein isoform X3 n=1 Tax=Taeniopygia guttata TaxID=59729 RepID=UPI003BB93E45